MYRCNVYGECEWSYEYELYGVSESDEWLDERYRYRLDRLQSVL